MVWWCLSIRPSVRPSGSPSVRLSVRPSRSPSASFPHFSPTCSDIIELKFCIWLCFTALQIKFESRQFASSFVGVMPLLELRILEIHSFPHFSLTCFDMLSWNFAYDFFFTVLQIKFECLQFASIFVGVVPLLELTILEIHSFPHFSLTCFDILNWNFAYDFALLYYRPSLSVINLRQVLWELYPFWNLEYWKYTVFRIFVLHALTYWAEILHMTLFYCTTNQVRVSSICFKFWWELCTFWNLEYWKYTVFHTFLLHALTCWAEILHMTLIYCTSDQVRVSSICVKFCGSYAPLGN